MSKERAAQLVDAGIWLRLSGDLEGARRLFEQALKLDPQNQRAVELLAQEPTEVLEPKRGRRSPPEENPFERAPTVPGDVDWGAATDFVVEPPPSGPAAPASSPSQTAGDVDWSSIAAKGPPLPRQAPEVLGQIPLGDVPLPRTTVMFSLTPPPVGPAPRTPPPSSSASGSKAATLPRVSPQSVAVQPGLAWASSSPSPTAPPSVPRASGSQPPVVPPSRGSGSGPRPAATQPRATRVFGGGEVVTQPGAPRVPPAQESPSPRPGGVSVSQRPSVTVSSAQQWSAAPVSSTQLFIPSSGETTEVAPGQPSLPFLTHEPPAASGQESQASFESAARSPMPFMTETPTPDGSPRRASLSRPVLRPPPSAPPPPPESAPPQVQMTLPPSERQTLPYILPPPVAPVVEAPSATRKTVMYSARASPVPSEASAGKTRSPPSSRSALAAPTIVPLTPMPTSQPLVNALGGMPSKALEVALPSGFLELRPTLPFGQEASLRATLPFGREEPPRPTLPFGQEAPATPAPRTTLMFQSEPGYPPGGPPSTPEPKETTGRSTIPYSESGLSALDSDPDGPRDTQLFSETTAGPLGAHELSDVRPMVIRLDLDESIPEAPSIVDSLKDEVDGLGKPAAKTVVLTDTTPDSSDSRLSPPLISASPVPVLSPPSPVPPGASPPSPIPVAIPPGYSLPSPEPRPLDSSGQPWARSSSGSPPPLSPVPQLTSPLTIRGAGRGSTPPPLTGPTDAWNWSASPPTREQAIEGLAPAPAPRPSPALTAQASSAWDVRGNPGIRIEDMVGPDRTLELVSAASKASKSPDSVRVEVSSLLAGARDLMDLDDHTGAMELIAKAQLIAPDDLEVQQLRDKSERTLLAMFESKLGSLEVIPRVMLKDDEIIWLNLDHRAGFVLAQIDGSVTFEDLFAVSGMTRLDTSRILAQLMDEGVITRGNGR